MNGASNDSLPSDIDDSSDEVDSDRSSAGSAIGDPSGELERDSSDDMDVDDSLDELDTGRLSVTFPVASLSNPRMIQSARSDIVA